MFERYRRIISRYVCVDVGYRLQRRSASYLQEVCERLVDGSRFECRARWLVDNSVERWQSCRTSAVLTDVPRARTRVIGPGLVVA